MDFNGKINSDGTIRFDAEEWTCTDVDNFQYCRKVDDATFEYIQLKDLNLVKDSLCTGRNALRYLNNETKPCDWYQEEIDINDYNEEEQMEYVSSFGGEDFLDGSKGASRNQLIAECIFETDVVIGY